jgi:FkbM family methyltransferase
MSESHYLGDHRILTRTNHGVRMIVDTRDIILTPLLLLNGEWEPETTKALLHLLRPGQHFVDVGANMGYFSCLAASVVLREGTGKVTAFEADPENFSFLRDNLNLNWHFERVSLVNAAAFNHETTLTFQKREKYQGNSSIGHLPIDELDSIGDKGISFEVPAVTLDQTIEGRVDLIKIDVEGAEPYVFEGMTRILAEQPHVQILVEWSPHQIERAGRSPPADMTSMMSGFTKHLVLDDLLKVNDGDLHSINHGMLLLSN